ncbi:tdpoz3 [Trichonephila clavata]|uniref:Tdpoz3 n=1 Tax=Trichonephila clavata TaxID=2740835 RepID=A0A8X6HBZ9_TRICU|nr:tdpoz3 [Trichonephila clavata]
MACDEDTGSENWTTFFWNVENCNSIWNKYGGIIYSPTFEVNSIEKFHWNIQLYSHGNIDDNLISYFLHGNSFSGEEECVLEYDLAILAEDGSVLEISKRERIYVDEEDTWIVVSPEDMPIIGTGAVTSRDTLRLRCRLQRTDGKDAKPATFFARTVLSVKKRNFLWGIERFSSLKPGHKVTCAIRSHEEENEMTLSIQVNTVGKIMIFIDSYEKMEFLKFQPFIINTNGRKVNCGKYEKVSSEFKKGAICTLPFTKKYWMLNHDSYLKNDVLSLYCECSWRDGSPSTGTIERIDFGISSPCIGDEVSSKSYTSPAETSQLDKISDLKEDLQCLYEEGIFSDVKLRTTTQTFKVHKTILSARSPVFRAMLSIDMKEKIHECVDVPDLEDDTVRRMLIYIYTNELEGLQWESASKLYVAADKYEIIALKSKCRSFLKWHLEPNNLYEVLILADMHADGDLKEAVQNFILTHEDILRSDEWTEFTKNNSTLAAETMLLIWKRKN